MNQSAIELADKETMASMVSESVSMIEESILKMKFVGVIVRFLPAAGHDYRTYIWEEKKT